MSKPSEEFEYFEYPPAWATDYCAGRGNLKYFAQYALMDLLLGRHAIRSLTWLFVASVDLRSLRRMRSGELWTPASPRPSRNNPAETQRRRMKWDIMRAEMGSGFDTVQRAIVDAGFTGYEGEPDLFCYADDGTWFFAEAKTANERFRPSQEEWFAIAENLPGVACHIYRCRVVPEGYQRPESTSQHTPRWSRMMAARSSSVAVPSAGALATPNLLSGSSRDRDAV